jgi:hypothetical protein
MAIRIRGSRVNGGLTTACCRRRLVPS